MKDFLTDQLRERLAGHEMDVPGGVWEHVSGQLAAAASGESLRHALQQKFRSHEVHVDPSAWANISGQLGQGAAAGGSLGLGWIAAGVAAIAITAGVIFWNSHEAPKQTLVNAPVAAEVKKPAEIKEVSAPPTVDRPAGAPKINPGSTASAKNSVAPAVQRNASTTGAKNSVPSKIVEPMEAVPLKPAQPPASAMDAQPETMPAAHTDNAPLAQTGTKEVVTTSTATPTGPAVAATQEAQESRAQSAGAHSSTDGSGNANTSVPFGADTDNGDIFIPTAFSPNGDAVNENFGVELRDHTRVDVRIFSAKTGSMVFQTNDLGRKWDGRLPNGNFADEGNYQCVVNWTDHDGRIHSKNVTVRLFR